MSCFAKIYSSIFTGSLRGHSDEILVFVNILTHTTHDGKADIHPNTIVDETGLTPSRVRKAIGVLSSPDPESRSPLHEGRRLILLDPHRAWGWKVVNHDFYRNLSGDGKYRESARKRVKKFRDLQALSDDRYVTETIRNGCNIDSVSVSVPVQEGGKGGGVPEPKILLKQIEEFWNLYPNKSKIVDTQRAWIEVHAYECFQEIMESVRRHLKSDAWRKEGGKYIPNPGNWLREMRWKDVPTSNGSNGIPLLQKERIITDRIAVSPANKQGSHYNPNCSDEEKAKLKQMREVLNNIKNLLAAEAMHGNQPAT